MPPLGVNPNGNYAWEAVLFFKPGNIATRKKGRRVGVGGASRPSFTSLDARFPSLAGSNYPVP